MSISNDIVWEVRPTAGNDANGGGYKTGASGTDFTQQNSPQYALTGVTSSGAGNVVLSASAAADMVGNLVQVISGTNFTAGFYEITSVSVGVSITVSTNNSGGAICSGVGALGVLNIGGALATVDKAILSMRYSNTCYIKKTGTYTITASTTYAINGTTSDKGPTRFIGYDVTRGDNVKISWTTSTNNVDGLKFSTSGGIVLQNINFSSTAGTPGHGLNATANVVSGLVLINCDIHGFNQGIRGNYPVDWSFGTLVVFKSRIYSNTSHGIFNTSGVTLVLGSYIHTNGGDGISWSAAGGPIGITVIWRSVIKSNTGKGINNSAQGNLNNNCKIPVVLESDILDNGSDGILVSNASFLDGLVCLNSIVDGNTGFGINFAQTYSALQLLGSIAFRSNTGGDVQNITKSGTDVTLSGDPFTARGSDDFTLNGTAGAGAACKAIGEPTTFP